MWSMWGLIFEGESIVDDNGKPLGLLHVHDCLASGVI